MPLVVENGTGVPGADSYVSVSEADAYVAANGGAGWSAANSTAKESALRRATQYVDARYRFRGHRLNLNQSLEWPRGDVLSGVGLSSAYWFTWPPRNLKAAVIELAVKSLSEPLWTDVDPRAVKSEQVGPIAVTYDTQQSNGQRRFPLVDSLLREITIGGQSTVKVEVA